MSAPGSNRRFESGTRVRVLAPEHLAGRTGVVGSECLIPGVVLVGMDDFDSETDHPETASAVVKAFMPYELQKLERIEEFERCGG